MVSFQCSKWRTIKRTKQRRSKAIRGKLVYRNVPEYEDERYSVISELLFGSVVQYMVEYMRVMIWGMKCKQSA